MSIETEDELRGLQRAGAVVAETLQAMRSAVRVGITTAELDGVADGVLARYGARGAPREVYGFPGTTCISVNDEVVHGIPGERVLADGDLVTLDVTVELDGFYADAAQTVQVGTGTRLGRALCAAAEAAFWRGARYAQAGRRLSSLGSVIGREVERHGFAVITELCGHGIGRTIHEEPSVPNHYDPHVRGRLTEGLVITIEPLISSGSARVREADDGWTVRTLDRSLTAHFEHTLVITAAAPIVITERAAI